jgi:hypothetical protein
MLRGPVWSPKECQSWQHKISLPYA